MHAGLNGRDIVAEIRTSTVKAVRPRVGVEHQASIDPGSWNNGARWPRVAQNSHPARSLVELDLERS